MPSLYRLRDCCGTKYDSHHRDDCPVRGIAARAALPCSITGDGWCKSHSTDEGPAYCQTTDAHPARPEVGEEVGRR